MPSRWWKLGRAFDGRVVLEVGVGQREQVGEDGQDDDQDDPAHADPEEEAELLLGVSDQPPRSAHDLLPRWSAKASVCRSVDAHSRAILGSTMVNRKSMMKLITTMAMATTRVMPWTTR